MKTILWTRRLGAGSEHKAAPESCLRQKQRDEDGWTWILERLRLLSGLKTLSHVHAGRRDQPETSLSTEVELCPPHAGLDHLPVRLCVCVWMRAGLLIKCCHLRSLEEDQAQLTGAQVPDVLCGVPPL